MYGIFQRPKTSSENFPKLRAQSAITEAYGHLPAAEQMQQLCPPLLTPLILAIYFHDLPCCSVPLQV